MTQLPPISVLKETLLLTGKIPCGWPIIPLKKIDGCLVKFIDITIVVPDHCMFNCGVGCSVLNFLPYYMLLICFILPFSELWYKVKLRFCFDINLWCSWEISIFIYCFVSWSLLWIYWKSKKKNGSMRALMSGNSLAVFWPYKMAAFMGILNTTFTLIAVQYQVT